MFIFTNISIIILFSTVLSCPLNLQHGVESRETCNVKYCTTRRYGGLWPLLLAPVEGLGDLLFFFLGGGGV